MSASELKVTALVPAYNEEKTICRVLGVLNNSRLIDEIVVVDDASKDNTLKVVKGFKKGKGKKKVKVVALKKNKGKGGAVREGAKAVSNEIVFLCDADLRGFKEEHLKKILAPFKKNRKVMSAGLRDYGWLGRKMYSQSFMPLIAGERALPLSVLKKALKSKLVEGYGLETVLNHYCRKKRIPCMRNVLIGLQHTTKVKKWNADILGAAAHWVKEMIQIGTVMVKIRNENI